MISHSCHTRIVTFEVSMAPKRAGRGIQSGALCTERGSKSPWIFFKIISIGSSFRKLLEKGNKEEELPIQMSTDCDENKEHLHNKFNHKIVVSDHVVLKNRWSNVSSSDLIFLNSEMLNDASSGRFSSLDSRNEQKYSMERLRRLQDNDRMTMNIIKEEMERKRVFESKLREIKQISTDNYNSFQFPTASDQSKAINLNDKKSISEIIVHPRFTESRNRDSALAQSNVKEERMRRLWLPIARKTVQWFANREARPPQSQGH